MSKIIQLIPKVIPKVFEKPYSSIQRLKASRFRIKLGKNWEVQVKVMQSFLEDNEGYGNKLSFLLYKACLSNRTYIHAREPVTEHEKEALYFLDDFVSYKILTYTRLDKYSLELFLDIDMIEYLYIKACGVHTLPNKLDHELQDKITR